jgi:hypothetical protein
MRALVAAWHGAQGALDEYAIAVLVRAVRAAPTPEGEAILLCLLEADDEAIRLDAILALEAIGSVSVVADLRALANAGGSLADPARDAIRAIHARAGNPEAGALALADHDAAGALALVDVKAS